MLGVYGGWWREQVGEVDAAIARDMANTLQGQLTEEARLPGGVLLGRRHHGILDQRTAVATSADGRWRVVVDGELLDREALLRKHLRQVDLRTAADSAATALALLEVAGLDWLPDAQGLFTIAGFDSVTQTLFLATDRFGLRPVYVHGADGTVQFSSDLLALAVAARDTVRLSRNAVQEWATFGMFLDDTTWFDGVRQLPGATLAQWTRDGYAERRYWAWSALERQQVPRREADAVSEVCERWTHVMRRQAPGALRAIVPLSGGLDSRLLLAGVPRDADVHALTFGVASSPDVQIARTVAALRGCRHHVLPIDGSNWLNGRFEVSNQTDCMVNAIHGHNVIGLPLLHQLGGICYDGYLGDATIGGSYLPPADANIEELLVARLSSGGPLAMDAGAARERILASWRRSGLRPELFLIESRGRRFINVGTWRMRLGTEVRAPFFDDDFLPFVMALPDRWRADSRIYRQMLTRLHPDYFARIPWEKTGLPITARPWQERAVRIGKRVVDRAQRFASYRLRLNLASSYVNYEAWSRTPAVCQWLDGLLLDRDARWPGWLDADRGRRLVRDHLAGRQCRTDAVLCLASLESWLRHVEAAGVRIV